MTALWECWPRNPDLTRTSDPVKWSQLDLTERDSLPHTWTITTPITEVAAFLGGGGCILDRNGEQIVSGRLTGARGDLTTATLTFEGDKGRMWDRLAWPAPAHVLAATASAFGAAADTRSGPRETILLEYLTANLGSAALASRRMTDVALPATMGRGGTAKVSARMDVLGDLVTKLADAGGLVLDMVHDESTGTPRILTTVSARADRTDTVVFGDPDSARATQFVTNLSWSYQRPEYTDAVVFAAGDQDARLAALFRDADASDEWAWRREGLVNYSITDDDAELTERGTTALADAAPPVSLTFDVSPSGDLAYRADYRLGDTVSVELSSGLEDLVSDNTVREVRTTVATGQAEIVTVTIGNPGADLRSTKTARMLAAALRRIANLERSR